MMTRMTRRTGVALTGIAAVLGASLLASPAAAADGTNFYVPKPNHGAVEQIADLTSRGDKADADLIEAMVDTPQAVWFEGGTPKQVEQDVRNTVARAEAKKRCPSSSSTTSLPRLLAVLGWRRDRHRRVPGLGRRIRRGHR